jgi:hypothetical protein
MSKRIAFCKVLWVAILCLIVGSTAVGAQQGVKGQLSAPREVDTDVVSVHTAWSVDYGRPGDQIVLAIIFQIDAGYHINADPNQIISFDEFKPYPTRIIVKKVSDGVTIESPRFPKAEAFKVEYASGDLMTFAGQTIIYLPMKLAEQINTKLIRLKLEVTYQACNDKICLFPENITFNPKIPVVETNVPPAKINREFFSNYESGGTGNLGVVRFDLFGWYFSFKVSSWTGLTI